MHQTIEINILRKPNRPQPLLHVDMPPYLCGKELLTYRGDLMRAPLKEQDTEEKKDSHVLVRVPGSLRAKILKIAKKEDRPITTVIRWILLSHFK